MTIEKILSSILIGALLGMLGQAIRILLGLKKDKTVAAEDGRKAVINHKKMGVSIFISLAVGAIAGVLQMLLNPDQGNTKEFIFTIILCGYSGSDFIEGLLKSLKIEPFGPAKSIRTIPS
ncbi:MAG TPA: hypothetical protein VHY08_01835 [Bacillota bacterium]|nr:hypothetical protein [Bacillota bacterium]